MRCGPIVETESAQPIGAAVGEARAWTEQKPGRAEFTIPPDVAARSRLHLQSLFQLYGLSQISAGAVPTPLVSTPLTSFGDYR